MKIPRVIHGLAKKRAELAAIGLAEIALEDL